jgi:hypothetical protein
LDDTTIAAVRRPGRIQSGGMLVYTSPSAKHSLAVGHDAESGPGSDVAAARASRDPEASPH